MEKIQIAFIIALFCTIAGFCGRIKIHNYKKQIKNKEENVNDFKR